MVFRLSYGTCVMEQSSNRLFVGEVIDKRTIVHQVPVVRTTISITTAQSCNTLMIININIKLGRPNIVSGILIMLHQHSYSCCSTAGRPVIWSIQVITLLSGCFIILVPVTFDKRNHSYIIRIPRQMVLHHIIKNKSIQLLPFLLSSR